MPDPHEPHQLELRDIAHHYGSKRALHQVNWQSTCGQRVAFLGPNGAGKTTLIRLLAGLLPLQTGTLTWRKRPLAQSRKEVAYLPQLDSHQRHFPIKVREVIAMGRYPHLGPFRRFTTLDQEKTDAALEQMNLGPIANRQIDQLSGGQQQRTFIARALAQEAHVLLLDEPFNGLDVESRCHLSETLAKLSEKGHLILASHHQLETVDALFTHALVLNAAQVAFGKASDVLADPEVRNLLHHCHPHAAGAL